MPSFQIAFLDHVAIRVKDMEVSIRWYEEVLGLVKHQLEEWGDFPVFMFSRKTGVAIFPANLDDTSFDKFSRNVKIDHFAFNVTSHDFEKAQLHFEEKEIKFEFQDHHYFHSIYLKDPDGHTVELTTLVIDENQVYQNIH